MPSRRWWLRWIGWGLVGCAAGVLAVGGGMGVAAGVPFVGLFILIITGLAVVGALGARRRARRGALESQDCLFLTSNC